MTRPFVTATLLIVCTFTPLSCQTEEPERPNILFVYIDDMGYGDLSCYGNERLETPNIDALARRGTKFEQFYVASPICSPSRVGITTGHYPARYGIHSYLASRSQNRRRGMADFLDPKAPAVARAFKLTGYATGHFGKWHQGGGRDVDNAPHPKEYGRDDSYLRPGLERDQSPNCAIREGDWKLLMNADGSDVELCNLKSDPIESVNLAEKHPDVAERLSAQLMEWRRSVDPRP